MKLNNISKTPSRVPENNTPNEYFARNSRDCI
jgi:hypothetical protein